MGIARGAPVLVPGFEFRVRGADPPITVQDSNKTRYETKARQMAYPELETRNPKLGALFFHAPRNLSW
jgi:hypothetical protein